MIQKLGNACDALDRLKVTKTCCRSVLLTYVDMTEPILDFERANELRAPDDTSDRYVVVESAPPNERYGDQALDDFFVTPSSARASIGCGVQTVARRGVNGSTTAHAVHDQYGAEGSLRRRDDGDGTSSSVEAGFWSSAQSIPPTGRRLLCRRVILAR